MALVVRREDGGVRRYVHLGTGNYNSTTARLYTDVGLFTCQPDDRRRRLATCSTYLTGYRPPAGLPQAVVAPQELREPARRR